MDTKTCPMGIENRQRIVGLEQDVSEVKAAINDIRDRLLGRPSWIVLFLFTIMSSAIVGLVTMILHQAGSN